MSSLSSEMVTAHLFVQARQDARAAQRPCTTYETLMDAVTILIVQWLQPQRRFVKTSSHTSGNFPNTLTTAAFYLGLPSAPSRVPEILIKRPGDERRCCVCAGQRAL